jgi:GT2 family glycosyltransferase
MLPFYMGVRMEVINEIGGYDEDFTGIAFDDDDFVNRLQMYGCQYKYVSGQIIHLYHERNVMENSETFWQKWNYNKNIFDARKNIIKRNEGKLWGVL